MQLMRFRLDFVAYVICDTDRWTPLNHNPTYEVMSGEIVDANANFVLLSAYRGRPLRRFAPSQQSIGIEAAAGFTKDRAAPAVQSPARRHTIANRRLRFCR